MKKDILKTFIERMKKLNIDITMGSNYPWIYIHTINGKRIKEDDFFCGNHGFTIAFTPIRNDHEMKFTDIGRIFKLIRKYK